MRLGVGQVVGRYRVVRALGTGGTAVVYLVHDMQTGSSHALKVLTVSSQTIRTRMQREGHVQAQLHHPNVVQIHDVLEFDGSPALLMEYVAGTTLDAALKRYRLTLGDAELLFTGILDGVQAAHEADLVHRDLKPANVLLARTTDGFLPKVADFGLAKVLFPEPGTAHTRAGISMGTPSYMAPEQIRDAGSVDQRADLWSLGCLLYEIVTRKRAFPGRQALGIYNNVVNGRYEPPQNFVPDLPVRLQEAITGCLQVDPDRRIPSCHTLHEVLQGTRSWAASPPPMLEVPEDAWSADILARVVVDEAADHGEEDADTTSDETAFEDAPLMPLAGSTTEHTGSYLPDDPPAVAEGPLLLESLADNEASMARAEHLDPEPSEELELELDPPVAPNLSIPDLPRPEPSRPDTSRFEPRPTDFPLLEVDSAEVPLVAVGRPWRVFVVAALLLLVLGGAGVMGLVGGAWLAATAVRTDVTEPAEPEPEVRAAADAVVEVAAEPAPDPPEAPGPAPQPARSPSRSATTAAPAPRPVPRAPAEAVAPHPRPAAPEPEPEPTVAADAPAQAVLLRSFPFGARVEIDGDPVGRAPRKVTLTQGSHAVQMVSGQQRARFEVVVEAEAGQGWCYNFMQQTLVTGPCDTP